jgi:multidrug efflux pump
VNLSAIFIHRPIATVLLMVGLLLCGLIAYPLLPVAALPEVNYPSLQVSAQLPGADPQTMASSVATPLEQQFSQIPGLTQMTSSSGTGYTEVSLQFELSRTLASADADALTAINAATPYLPVGMPYPPTIKKVNPADPPVLELALTSDSLPLIAIDAYAENILVPKISQIPGVGLIGIGGEQHPAVRVQVNPQALASRGVSLEDVRTVLGEANVDQPKGQLYSPSQTYTLNTNDILFKPDQYADLIVAYRNGSPVRIRDVGRVTAAGENELLAAWANNKRGIILGVQREPNANVVDTVDRVLATLPQLEASIPRAIKVSVLSNRTQSITASVKAVESALMIAVVLVVMVIFLFLRNVRATLIPTITVPLSLIGTFAFLYEFNYSLDNLSLMALTVAVGLVVDDAVVVIENIVRHLEAGLTPMEAALKGAGEIGFTILAITLSLIAVFIPLFLMGGYVGKLFQEVAVTVSVALLLSLLISLSLAPMLCSRLLKQVPDEQHGRLYRLSERMFDGLVERYHRGLRVALRHRFTTLMIMLGTIVLTGYLYYVIPKGFFPQEDTGLIIGVAKAAQDVSYVNMAQRMEAMTKIVLEDPAVATVGDEIGPGGGTIISLNQGLMFISLKPENQRDVSADEIIRRLQQKLARIQGITLYMQAAQDINIGARLSPTEYQYTLTDADANELSRWAAIFYDKLKTLPQVVDVATDQQNSGLLLNVTINREVASSYGILPSTIDNTLYDAFGQRIVSTIYASLNQYHVVLEVSPQYQYGPDALSRIYVNSSSGQQVPLNTLVTSVIKTAPVAINHQGVFPSATLSFNLKPGVALGDAVDAIQKMEQETGKPASLAMSFQGNASAFQSALKGTPVLIAAAIVVIYIILGVLYENAIHPITILSTLPSAGIGALLLLMALHIDLTMIALLGIILLIGIVKKNGIMLVDFALEAERNEGLKPEESITKACLLRFRPILMTTMAAILGAVPLAFGTETGAQLRQPLGYTIIGGLAVSQVLTLFTTPIVYLYLDRFSAMLKRMRRDRSTPDLASTKAT